MASWSPSRAEPTPPSLDVKRGAYHRGLDLNLAMTRSEWRLKLTRSTALCAGPRGNHIQAESPRRRTYDAACASWTPSTRVLRKRRREENTRGARRRAPQQATQEGSSSSRKQPPASVQMTRSHSTVPPEHTRETSPLPLLRGEGVETISSLQGPHYSQSPPTTPQCQAS
jgi:hypothetical protein